MQVSESQLPEAGSVWVLFRSLVQRKVSVSQKVCRSAQVGQSIGYDMFVGPTRAGQHPTQLADWDK